MVLVIEKGGQVFQMTTTLSSVPSGALLGLFTAGMLCRRFNVKGAISGAIVSVLVVGFIAIGALQLPKQQILPMRTDGCQINGYGNAHVHRSNQSI